MQSLEENIEKVLQDIGLGKDFLIITLNSTGNNTKTDKLGSGEERA